jgi:hypothetical protein
MNYWVSGLGHGLRPGYSCESQVTTPCQDTADSLDNGGRIDAVMIDSSKAFDLILHDELEGSSMDKEIPVRLKIG